VLPRRPADTPEELRRGSFGLGCKASEGTVGLVGSSPPTQVAHTRGR
jgi:hypothetical protein